MHASATILNWINHFFSRMSSTKAMLLRYNKTVSWKTINPSDRRTFFETTRKLIKIRGILQNVMWQGSFLISTCQCTFLSTKALIYLNYYRLKYKKLARLRAKELFTTSSLVKPTQGKKIGRISYVHAAVKVKLQKTRDILLRQKQTWSHRLFTTSFARVSYINHTYTPTLHFIHAAAGTRPGAARKYHLTQRRLKLGAYRAGCGVAAFQKNRSMQTNKAFAFTRSLQKRKKIFSKAGYTSPLKTLKRFRHIGLWLKVASHRFKKGSYLSRPSCKKLATLEQLKTFTYHNKSKRILRQQLKVVETKRHPRRLRKIVLKRAKSAYIKLAASNRPRPGCLEGPLSTWASLFTGITKSRAGTLYEVACLVGQHKRARATSKKVGQHMRARATSKKVGQHMRARTVSKKVQQSLLSRSGSLALTAKLATKYFVLNLNKLLSSYLKTSVDVFANDILSTKATQLLTVYQTQLSASLPYFMHRFFFHRDMSNVIVCTTILRSSHLLAFYLARLLEKTPRHKWFFHIFNRFVSVFKFYCQAPISLKVLVKGRVNKKLRKHTVCVLRTQVALSQISSAVDYSLTHSFTRASVLGVKVWVVSNSKSAHIKTFDQKYRTY